MPRRGGEAGKLGDQYEGFWTVDQLVELCLGRATQICVEEVGDEADGVEFRLLRDDGVNSFHSVKRQRSDGEWSLAKLTTPGATGRSILGDLFKKLRGDSSASCVFVSATGANGLREACEAARKCASADDFDRLMQGMDPLRRELKERLVEANALADWSELHGLLRRIRAVLKDSASLRDDVEERLRAYFSHKDLHLINAADERRALGELVLDKLGVPLTASDALGFLESRGIVRRDSLAQPDARRKVKETVEHYLRVVNGDLVNGGSIPRDEVEAATKQLLDSNSSGGVLIEASAGFGKSCVLAQIITRLQKEVPTLVVRLDEIDAVRSTTELGTVLGFDVSPVAALVGIAGHRPCVFVVDQLDAVSELSGRKSTLWDVFERLRTEATRFPQLKFLVACRSFDLQHDHRLRRLTVAESGFTEIELTPLPLSTVFDVLKACGIESAAVSNAEKELLRVPLHLHLFLISYEKGQRPITTRQDLFDRFWVTKEVKVRNRCEGECHWQDVVDELVDNMSTRASLTAVDDVVAQWSRTVDAMASEHVLVRDRRRIRFFHESFVDYAFARGFAARGESLVGFLVRTDQGLFYRSLVRQVLTHLRDDDRGSYIQTLHGVMNDGQIRFHLKTLVLEWLSFLSDPTEDEWRLIEELSRTPEIADRSFWVIRNSTGWFDLLDGLGVVSGWMASTSGAWRNRALWLIRAKTVHEQRSSAVALLLRRWVGDKQRRAALLSAVVEQDVWRSEGMQSLFLDLLPEIIALPRQPSRHHDWWDAIHDAVKHAPIFVLRCVTLWIDGLISSCTKDGERSRLFEVDDVSQRAALALSEIAKSIPSDFIHALFPRIIKIVELTSNESHDGLITDRTWHVRSADDFHGMDSGILESTISALKELAGGRPSELDVLFASLSNSRYETVIYLMLRSWMSQPERYAETVLTLLCSKPEALDIGYSVYSGGNPQCAVSREAISKCLPYWTNAELAKIERTILNVIPYEGAEHDQIDWYRHVLLSSIDPTRLTELGRKTWNELHAKFPDADVRLPRKRGASFVGSPIPSAVTAAFSDDEWLEAMRKHNTDWSSGSRRHLDGTAVELSRVLQTQVEADPERFAALPERMADSIHPFYFCAILSGICPLNPPSKETTLKRASSDAVKAVIRRVHAIPTHPCGKEISHAFSRLDGCELESSLLEILEYYATFAPDPVEDNWVKKDDGGKARGRGDAHMAGYNSVRGSAARAIGHLLYERRDLLNRFLPIYELLVRDPRLSVRTCAIEALLPLFNFDRETAVRLFLVASEGADAILGTHPVDLFFHWFSNTHYNVLRPILLKALQSEYDDAVDSASRQICVASFTVAEAETDATIVVRGTERMRKAAAEVFASNLKTPECRVRCLLLLQTLFNDVAVEVRDVAANCWNGFDRDDLIREVELIGSYIESISFPSQHDQLIHQLEETYAPLPKLIIRVAERFLSAIKSHSDESPHPAVYEGSTIATLIFRLYSQTYDAVVRNKCLNLIDEMAHLRIDVDQQLAEHDR